MCTAPSCHVAAVTSLQLPRLTGPLSHGSFFNRSIIKVHEKNIRGKMESFDISAENFKGELTVVLSGKRMDKNIATF